MQGYIERVLIDETQLHRRVQELGEEITRDYQDGDDLLLVSVLKGSFIFMADLARAIKRSVAVDFIAAASYGAGSQSSGVIRILKDLDYDIIGKHVLLVEDIIDSGLTLRFLQESLLRRQPASLRICALLNKPDRRQVDLPIDYLGFDIPDHFVVGYGLDYDERFRNLPYIAALAPEAIHDA